MFLTRTELREWCNRYNRQPIIAWLKAERIAYTLDADGWPKVATELRDRRQGLVEGSTPAHHSEPDFAALKTSPA